jgi:hypothetical protein
MIPAVEDGLHIHYVEIRIGYSCECKFVEIFCGFVTDCRLHGRIQRDLLSLSAILLAMAQKMHYLL